MNIDYVIYNACEELTAIAHWGEYLLPVSWQKNLHTKKHPEQTIIGRMLLFQRLTAMGYDYGSMPVMKYTTMGKPYFENHIHFNFAYNKNIILVGVSEKEAIGIDVETMRPIPLHTYEQYFSTDEWTRIMCSSNPTRNLIDAWVTKEAANKLEGIKNMPVEATKIRIKQRRIHVNGQKFYHERVKLPAQYFCRVATKSTSRFRKIKVKNMTNQLMSSSSSMLYAVRA